MNFLRIMIIIIKKLSLSVIGAVLIMFLAIYFEDTFGIPSTQSQYLSVFLSLMIPMFSAFLFPWVFPILVKKYSKTKVNLIWIGIFTLLLLIDWILLCIDFPTAGQMSHFHTIGASILSVIIFTLAASLMVRKHKEELDKD
ncbi:MAG: hypothetical protein U9Q34_08350 [Elusimicrobiota bacterium]|nr:hypothetical protein [Elusimicrobiota bacterium]